MSSEQRVRRLRALIARIEQLPASSESERMLAEVRARVVDVDTGVTPRAMLPVDPDPTQLAADRGQTTADTPKAVARTRAEHDRARPGRQPPARRGSVYVAPPEAVSPSAVRTTAVSLSAAEDREWLSLVATNEVLCLDDSAPLTLAGEAPTGHDRRRWTRGLRG